MSVYYYRMAASYAIGAQWESVDAVLYSYELRQYPSLCYALGRELCSGENMCKDIERAYQFLKLAEKGYKTELDNGGSMYEQAYAGVTELLSSSQFDGIRAQYDKAFFDDYADDADDSEPF